MKVPGHRGRRGFSLLELIVVVVVMAVLATIVVPVYQYVVGRAHDDATRAELVAFTHNAYALAALGGTVLYTFDGFTTAAADVHTAAGSGTFAAASFTVVASTGQSTKWGEVSVGLNATNDQAVVAMRSKSGHCVYIKADGASASRADGPDATCRANLAGFTPVGSDNPTTNPAGPGPGGCTGSPDPAAVVLTINDPEKSAPVAPGTSTLFTFCATAGQRIAVVAGHNFQLLDKMRIDAPTTWWFANAGGGSSDPTMYTEALDVTEAGWYTITIDLDPGHAPTTAAVEVFTVAPDTRATFTLGGPKVSTVVTDRGQNVVFQFAGVAGTKVAVQLGDTLDWYDTIYSYNPDGTALSESTGTYSSASRWRVFNLTQTGVHTIYVYPKGLRVDTFTAQGWNVPPDETATLTIGGGPKTLTTVAPYQSAFFHFDGVAGQQIRVTRSGDFSYSTGVPVINPDGSYLDNYGGSSPRTTDVLTPPTTGTYSVEYDLMGTITVEVVSVP